MNLVEEIKKKILFPLEFSYELSFLLNCKKKILISFGSSFDNLSKLNYEDILKQYFFKLKNLDFVQ